MTSELDLAERLRRVREYGQTARYVHVERGVNSRLDELQAAVLRVKLGHLENWTQRREKIAGSYMEALTGSVVRPLARLPERRHVFHLFVVVAPERDALRAHLKRHGVKTLVHYPEPIHWYPPYRSLGDGPVPLERAERLCSKVVSLPIYPELRDWEVEHVATAWLVRLVGHPTPAASSRASGEASGPCRYRRSGGLPKAAPARSLLDLRGIRARPTGSCSAQPLLDSVPQLPRIRRGGHRGRGTRGLSST